MEVLLGYLGCKHGAEPFERRESLLEIGDVAGPSESHAFDKLPVLGGIFRIALHAIKHRHEPFLRRQVLHRALAAH